MTRRSSTRCTVSPLYLPISPLHLQAELHALRELNGVSVQAHDVRGSSSKAHNLEYALTIVDEEVVVLFDADHQPCADCVTKLVTTLQP